MTVLYYILDLEFLQNSRVNRFFYSTLYFKRRLQQIEVKKKKQKIDRATCFITQHNICVSVSSRSSHHHYYIVLIWREQQTKRRKYFEFKQIPIEKYIEIMLCIQFTSNKEETKQCNKTKKYTNIRQIVL